MKTFATPSPTRRTCRVPLRRPARCLPGPVSILQRAEIRRILGGPRLQARLTVGARNDAYEREADRVADAVMRMPEPEGLRRMCPECESELRPRPQAEVSPSSRDLPGQVPGVDPDLETRIQALRGGGQPLPEDSRAFFEPRFGTGFRAVRVHTDPLAAETARAVHARAFTIGTDIFFNAGEYRPRQTEGRRLLAHELTHVVQQSALQGAPRAEAIRRQEPVTTAGATVTLGAVAAKCIIGAIAGALFDAAIQAALHSIREWTWRFWRARFDYCSIILSAILGCIAAPISAFILEGWVTARLGTRLGGMAGTLIGKILLFIAKKLAIGIPKGLLKTLAKLGCISPEQGAELGVEQGEG